MSSLPNYRLHTPIVTARALRLATLAVLALGAAVLHVEPVAATTCIVVDPREDLARADAAFIGEVVSRRSVSGPQYPLGRAEILTFRVHEVVKGNLGELVEALNHFPSWSPPTPPPSPSGRQTGVLLYAIDGGFATSLCGGFISPWGLRLAQGGGLIVKKARDKAAQMSFRLRGRRLTVHVGRYPPRHVRRALRRRIKLACGNHISFSDYPERLGRDFPLATATARFRRGRRKLTAVLNRDVSRAATSCGAKPATSPRFIAAVVFPLFDP